jgi:lipopolysaccharide export system protein LptA
MKKLLTPIAFGLAVAALPAAAALAQGLGPDSDGKPMDITADELEVQNKACVSTWRGKAEGDRGQELLHVSTSSSPAGSSRRP